MFSVRPEVLVLLFIRVYASAMFLPVVSGLRRMAWLAVFCAATSWVLYPLAEAKMASAMPTSLEQLFIACCEQFLVGVMAGLWIRIALAAFEISGQLVGFQMGFAVADVFDPMTNVQASFVAHFEGMLAALIFFGANLHHTLFEGLLFGFGSKPWILGHPDAMLGALKSAGFMFEAALKISAPVIASLFLSKVALSILARAVPQINAFIFGFPITIGIGLLMLALTIPQISANTSRFLSYAMKVVNAIGR